MKKKSIGVKHRGLTVKIFVSRSTKGEKVYKSFQVADYSSGTRRLLTFADEGEARAKALEICEAHSRGQPMDDADLARLYLEKISIKNALQQAEMIGLSVDEAVGLLAQCADIIPVREILSACRFWKEHRPDKPFSPRTVKQAVADYMGRQHRLSTRRRKALKSYFGQFENKFGTRNLHEVTTSEIKDWMDTRNLSSSTYNSNLSAFAMIYKDAELRDLVPASCNPVKGIKRLKCLPGQIGIMTPEEVRTVLLGVEEELIPFLAVWFFGGLRKDEISRLDWRQLRLALKSGVLELDSDLSRKTGARSFSILPTLRAWLEWHLQRNHDAEGPVLPVKYSGRKLDNVQRTISRQSGVKWVANAGRHSYITYRCKLADSVTCVADEVGNSPTEIERRYRKKGVTVESAREFFGILPPVEAENVLPMASTA